MMMGLLVNLAQKERKRVCSAFSQLCCLDFFLANVAHLR